MGRTVFFKGWEELARTAVMAVFVYGGFIVLLRGSGKRTLAKMNVFDFVFVVALGSTLADTILNSDTTISRGLVACATLLALQVIISWLTTRSGRIEKWINGRPTLLFYRGQFLADVLKRERVTEEEIRAAVRIHNLASMDEIEAVVLETDGTFAVVWRNVQGSQSALTDIVGQENVGARKVPESKAGKHAD